MAIQYMDNFQFYGTGTDARTYMLAGMPWAQLYTEASLTRVVDDPDPNADSDSRAFLFAMNGTGSQGCRLALPTAGSEIGVAVRIWVSSLPSSYNHGPGIGLNTAGGATRYAVTITPTGGLTLLHRSGQWSSIGQAGNGTIVAETTGPVLTAGAWYHIEWYMDAVTGDYEVRVEGFTVLSGTDSDPWGGTFGILELLEHRDCTASDSIDRYVKDLVIWDTTGTTEPTFVGPVTVYSLPVDGDVSEVDATPSTGSTMYETMDELTPNDADYTTLGTSPSEMVLTFRNLPADVVAVRALQTVVRAKKTDGGDANIEVGLISGAAEEVGATHSNSTSFRYHYDIAEEDPDTAAPWTPVGVNAATVRVNRTL